MPDYAQGRIYKIVSDSTDKVYVGSTCQRLSARFSQHRSDKYSSRVLMEYDDVRCVLVEMFPCKTKEELQAREYLTIKELKDKNVTVVNRNMPTRTAAQYHSDNREQRNEKQACYYAKNHEALHIKRTEYYVANREAIKAQHATPFVCACGNTISTCEKSRHERSKKHIAWAEKQICPLSNAGAKDEIKELGD